MAQAWLKMQLNVPACDLAIDRISGLRRVKHLPPAIGGTITFLEGYRQLLGQTPRGGSLYE